MKREQLIKTVEEWRNNPFAKKWSEELNDNTQEAVEDIKNWNKYGESEISFAPFIIIAIALGIVCAMILSTPV